MAKRRRRILRWLGISLLLIVGLCLIGYVRFKQAPSFYRVNTLSAAERDAAASSAELKLVLVQNAAAQARADEYAARQQATTLPTVQPITLTITQDELNALLDKWSVWPSIRSEYAKFVADPYIALEDGRLILAGKMPNMDSVVSVHFTPSVEPDGRMKLTLSGVLAGRLPFPVALFSSYREQAAEQILHRMDNWRVHADVNKTGVANGSMINAVMGQLLMTSLNDQPTDPVLFLPLVQHGSIPVIVRNVSIEEHALTLTVEPMTPTQRQALVSAVRNGKPVEFSK